MINPQALESLFLATYLEDYFDSCENLPDDVQKQASRMRELDVEYQKFLKDVESQLTMLLENPNVPNPGTWKLKIQHALMSAQDKGDEKLQITQQIQDYMDNKVRQLDLDLKNLGYGREFEDIRSDPKVNDTAESRSSVKRARRARHVLNTLVPSSLGPPTLEPTSFDMDRSAMVIEPAQSSGRVTTLASSSTSASVTVAATVAIEQQQQPSKSSSAVSVAYSAESSGSGSYGKSSSSITTSEEKNGGSSSRDYATNSANNTNIPAATPKKQTQQKKDSQDKKYKKRKKQNDNSPPNIPIDPDEPTYCLCDQVSYGEMIGCDNDLCPIEWFHFSCVQLNSKPKGKWFCPKCRGDRPNIMKPKHVFLKELEKYNREKEEKS